MAESSNDMVQLVKVSLLGRAFALSVALGLWLVACTVPAFPSNSSGTSPARVRLAVQTPDAGWRLRIERIIELDRAVWILAQLKREPGPAAQMISTAEAVVPISLPAKALRIFVAGKTWTWRNEEPYEFVPTLAAVIRQAGSARVLLPAEGL
jgi:hypothetical protein